MQSQLKSQIFHHITNEETSVSKCLAKHFGLDSPRIGELFDLGAIYSNKKRVFEDRKLPRGAYLRIHLKPKRFPVDTVDWQAVLLHEEKEFVIVNKPFGIPVHATLDNNRDNLLYQLRERTRKPLLVTARLDINVSGLLLFAKTSSFQRQFNQWLLERKIGKRYSAIVEKNVAAGHYTHFMEPSERCPKKLSADPSPNWLRCELSVLSTSVWREVFQTDIELHTGRTHQIRAQMSALGAPILGDRMYGSKTRADFLEGDAIALCSTNLSFPRWQKEPWRFEISPPWVEKGHSNSEQKKCFVSQDNIVADKI
jgi:23S rRNA pseudouridine1911/1915/1917 synthase